MNQLLISELARSQVDERLEAAQRERLARRSRGPARRPADRLGRLGHRIRMSLSSWRARTQLGELSAPMCGDDCVDAAAP
jgi:hypothetical protein